MDTSTLHIRPVMHECLQVELAKHLLDKKDLKGLKSYMSRMKVCDIRTFQRMGTYLRNEEKESESMEKLNHIWCEIASSSKIVSNE